MKKQDVIYEKARGRLSRPDEAAARIEAMAAENGWTAGEKLPSQRELAERLDFSRPTIREALVALETLGRVVIRPGKGVFLTDPTSAAPLSPGRPVQAGLPAQSGLSSLAGREAQMYQFRYAVEPAIAGLVAMNATAAQIEDMAVVAAAMRRSMESGDEPGFARLDFTFHSHMIEAANNRFFTEAMAPFLGLFFESQTLPLGMNGDLAETMAEHEAVMEAIRERRSGKARSAMERHVRGVARRAGVNIVG